MNLSCLSARGIVKEFSSMQGMAAVLHGVTFDFVQGTSYAIMGASGSGKSTLIHLLAGLDLPTKGELLLDGRVFTKEAGAERALFLQQTIGLVFQNPHLIRELSVLENVMLPQRIAGKRNGEAAERARTLLAQVGLADFCTYNPLALSRGQQQRVALARALSNNPRFLIADEPTGNLDEKTGQGVIDLLLELQKANGMGIVVSTHDVYVAERLGTIVRLENGVLNLLARN